MMPARPRCGASVPPAPTPCRGAEPPVPRGADHRERIGVSLSDEWQLHPEQSTSAIVVLHPRAKYFSV